MFSFVEREKEKGKKGKIIGKGEGEGGGGEKGNYPLPEMGKGGGHQKDVALLRGKERPEGFREGFLLPGEEEGKEGKTAHPARKKGKGGEPLAGSEIFLK